MAFNGIVIFIIAGLIKYSKRRKKWSKSHAKKCKPFGSSYYRTLTVFKVSKIKLRRQNRNSFHKVSLNIVIIHYIFSNLNYIFCSNFHCILIILYFYKSCHL